MAGVHALKSTGITNRDATPRTINNPAAFAGMLKGFVGQKETADPDQDSIGSTFRLGQIPSNAVIHSLKIFSDDMGSTAAAIDIGIYKNTADGGAVVDADFFAAAVSLKDGALNGTEVIHNNTSTGNDIAKAEKPLWQALGLASDPNLMYDVVATATGAVDTAGTLCLKGVYAV